MPKQGKGSSGGGGGRVRVLYAEFDGDNQSA